MKAIDRVEELARKLLDDLDVAGVQFCPYCGQLTDGKVDELPAARELRLALVSLDVERSYEVPAAGQKASSL